MTQTVLLPVGFLAFLTMLAAQVQAGGWLVIQEVHYCTPAPTDEGEFLEIYSSDPPHIDLSGYTIEGDVYFTFPEGTRIQGGEHLVVARNPEVLAELVPPGVQVLGPWEGTLGNRGGHVRLKDRRGIVAAQARWGCGGAWPASCGGTGHTLSLRDPLTDPLEPANWSPSPRLGGTPGAPNGYPDGLIDLRRMRDELPVLINEVVPGAPGESMVELRNLWPQPIDVGGCTLTAHPGALDAVRLPPDTVIPPRGTIVATTALPIEHDGAFVGLVSRDGSRVRDAVRLGQVLIGRSYGRRGGLDEATLVLCGEPTPGEPNVVPVNVDLVINEVMYHPPAPDGDLEFIEITNRGDADIDLSGYHLEGGVRFTFPAGARIAPGAFLVIARDPARLQHLHGLEEGMVVGPYQGKLSNSGERIVLLDAAGGTCDLVDYADDGEWPQWADGYGSSMELIHPGLDNSLPGAWASSDESSKTEWKQFSYTGEHKEFQGQNIQELQFMLLGPGEILLDDVHLGAGADLVSDGSFEKGAIDWIAAGTHERSGVTQIGAEKGASSYRLVAEDAGDPRENFVTLQLGGGLQPDRRYRILFKARWLKGCPLLLTRTGGQGVARLHRLIQPSKLGTPGAANTAAASAPTPVIGGVEQWPATPRLGEPVAVTARVSGIDVRKTLLHWRQVGEAEWQSVPLVRTGESTSGRLDAGMHAAVIPGDAAVEDPELREPSGPGKDGKLAPESLGRMVEFYLSAADATGSEGTWPVGAPGETALFQPGVVVRSSVPQDLESGSSEGPTRKLPQYTLLVAPRQWTRMETRPRMSDQLISASLLVGRDRIIHGVGFRKRGSPFHREGGGNWRVEIPRQRALDGRTALNFDDQGLGSRAGRGLQERTVFWLLDQVAEPNVRLRYVHFRIPGHGEEGTFEEVERIGGPFRERWWPGDDDGNLHKVDDYFEFLADGSQKFIEAELAYLGTDPELYRWNFPRMGRAMEASFEPLIRLIGFMDPRATRDSAFGQRLSQNLDWQNWAKVLAVRSYCDDWDSLGSTRGKNAFLYYPLREGRWKLVAWDCDLTFANATRPWVPDKFPAIARLLSAPWVKRVFDGTLWYCANGPLHPDHVGEILQPMAAISGAPTEGITKFSADRLVQWQKDFSDSGAKLRAPRVKRVKGSRDSPDLLRITGSAPPQVLRFFLEGREFAMDFADSTRYRGELPIGPEGGKLDLIAADAGGRELARVGIKIPAREDATPLPRPGLRAEDSPLDPDLQAWRERAGLAR